jgi:hypothetical protein
VAPVRRVLPAPRQRHENWSIDGIGRPDHPRWGRLGELFRSRPSRPSLPGDLEGTDGPGAGKHIVLIAGDHGSARRAPRPGGREVCSKFHGVEVGDGGHAKVWGLTETTEGPEALAPVTAGRAGSATASGLAPTVLGLVDVVPPPP